MKFKIILVFSFICSFLAFAQEPPVPPKTPQELAKEAEVLKLADAKAKTEMETSKKAFEAVLKKVGEDSLKLITGPNWPGFSRNRERANQHVILNEYADAARRFKKITKLLKESMDSIKLARLKDGSMQMGLVKLNPKTEMVSFPAKLIYVKDMPIEVIISSPNGRTHEALLISDARPFCIQNMLQSLGAVKGVKGKEKTTGSRIDIIVSWKDAKGKERRVPVEDLLQYEDNNQKVARGDWVFTGSDMHDGFFLADMHGDLVQTTAIGNAILNTAVDSLSKGERHLDPKVHKDIKEDTPVTVYLKIRPGSPKQKD